MKVREDINWEVFFPPGARVSLLPNPYEHSTPRLAIAGRSPVTRWQASAFYPAYRWTGQMWRFGLRMLATANHFSRRTVPQHDWPLGAFLTDALPAARNITVLFGMPGPGQQITVQVRDQRNRVLGYVKYAEAEVAKRKLANEHALLTALPPRVAPQVLKYGTFHEGMAMVSTPLRGRKVQPVLPPRDEVLTLLKQLVRPDPPVALDAHPYLTRLPRTAQVTRLLDQLSGRPWPIVFQHGDFLPWNLRYALDGSLRAFDWEHGTQNGFPLLDLAYHLYFACTMVRNYSEKEAEQAAASFLLTQSLQPVNEREALALVRLSRFDALYHGQRFNPDPDMTPDAVFFRDAS